MAKKKKRKRSMQKRDKLVHRGFNLKAEWADALIVAADALGLQIVDTGMVNEDTLPLAIAALTNLRNSLDSSGDRGGISTFFVSDDGEPLGYVIANRVDD